MPKTKRKTRHSSDLKFGGGPSPLIETEPPTYRDIIKFSYFQNKSNIDISSRDLSTLILGDLVNIWKTVNPRIPLLSDLSIENKINTTITRASEINRKSLKNGSKEPLRKNWTKCHKGKILAKNVEN